MKKLITTLALAGLACTSTLHAQTADPKTELATKVVKLQQGPELDRLVSRVEDKLHGCGETDIPSHQIGELVMNELAVLNEVAYVRFASVYRQFKDIDELRSEIDQLARKDVQP